MKLLPERGSSSAIYCHKKEVPKKALLLCRRFLTCKAAASDLVVGRIPFPVTKFSINQFLGKKIYITLTL